MGTEQKTQRAGGPSTRPRAKASSTPRPRSGKGLPIWASAAESVAQAMGVAQTVADVLHARALKHFSEGLRQYLTVRLGDVERARTVLGALRAATAAWPAEKLVAPPGPRARLFALAREMAETTTNEAGDRASLPWRVEGSGGVQLLAQLDPVDAQLLELVHARGLADDEAAYALGLASDGLATKLAEAEGRAAAVLAIAPEGDVAEAIAEAFALVPDLPDEEAEDGPALPEGTLVGARYRLSEHVGSGAFGDVYRAIDEEVAGHEVALKVLHQPSLSEEARATALRELRLIASVFHPSIVSFKDHGWHDQRLWFVMPWYKGTTLERRVRKKPLSRAEARRVFEPLARALATMHAAGLRHQDIKPDNVFLAEIRGFGEVDDERGEEILPVLIDLGVAAKEAEMLLAGTPTYFAPEVAAQFAGVQARTGVTTKADVFSLALTLRNALEPETQEEVVGGKVEAFVEMRAEHRPDAPRGKDLRYLAPHFARWLSLDPEKRPTANEFADSLAILTAPEERRARLVRTLKWLVPLVLSLVAVFGALGIVLVRESEKAKAKAAAAENEAESARADLSEAEVRERALANSVEALQARAERGQLDRAQVVAELANTARQVAALHEDLAAARGDLRELRATKAKLEEARTLVEARLDATLLDLEAERRRGHDLDAQLTQRTAELTTAREQQAATQREAEARAARITELEAQARQLTQEASAAQARAEELTSRASEAEALRGQLEAAQRENARLTRALEEATTQPAPAEPTP